MTRTTRRLIATALAAAAIGLSAYGSAATASDTDAFIIDDDAAHWDADIGLLNGGVIPAAAAQLFRVYYGALGRLPDNGGFTWWSNEITLGNHDLRSMASGFIFSDEFQSIADGDSDGSVSNAEFIDHMYRIVFGRAPDPGGLAWWTDELASGRRSQTDALVEMTQSNEYVALTLAAVADYLPFGGTLPPGDPGPGPGTPPISEALLDTYDKSCAVCHAAGVAGAAITGDTAAWQPLLAKGMDTLVASVVNGLNAMPPLGMCFDCSEDDYRALIAFMATGDPRSDALAAIAADMTPLIVVAPVYPSRAQRRGITGYCVVSMTVTTTGTVAEPIPLDCEPEGIFERASVEAAAQFRYQPPLLDGQPVEVPGVTHRFEFTLDDPG